MRPIVVGPSILFSIMFVGCAGQVAKGVTAQKREPRTFRNPVRKSVASSDFTPRTSQVPNEEEILATAITRIGQAATPDLIRSLDDDDARTRRIAAELLGRIGPDAQEAVPALIASLEDESPIVRKAAAKALGEIGPAAKEAAPVLVRALLRRSEIDPVDFESP